MNQHSELGGASDSPDSQPSAVLASRGSSAPPITQAIDTVLYDRLRGVASHYLRREAPGHPFEPTDLVNEAFVRMARGRTPIHFHTSDHFVAISAIVMRHILIDQTRSATIFNRVRRMPLENDLRSEATPLGDALAIRQALRLLARSKTRLYRIVEMRVFKGLTFEQIGEALSISPRTAKRDWKLALGQLRKELTGSSTIAKRTRRPEMHSPPAL